MEGRDLYQGSGLVSGTNTNWKGNWTSEELIKVATGSVVLLTNDRAQAS